ncbi:odorant receptor Or2-like [Photinus pyralis]|uniref:odorant receptor Or2-like n=1 Tax=Photinus pyralis TaxID=7054 RepID=UPI0012674528|nr:odorant receptor Or2-like [Photinus pyralis]
MWNLCQTFSFQSLLIFHQREIRLLKALDRGHRVTRVMEAYEKSDRAELPKHLRTDGVKWLFVPVKVILDALSVWPERQNKITLTLSLAVIISYLYIFTAQISFILDKNTDLSTAADAIAGVIAAIETAGRRIISIFLAKKIAKILLTVYFEFWPSDLVTPELSRLLTRRSWILLVAVACYTSSALFWSSQCLTVPFQLRDTPLPSKFTFPYLSSPFYEMVYIWEGVLSVELAINICSFDWFFMSVIWSCTAQFRLLREYLKANFVKAEASGQAWELMVKCIKHHQLLIETTKNIEGMLTVFILIVYLGTVGTVCLSGFLLTIVRTEFGRPLTYFCGHMSQIFLYCFIGNELSRESLALADSVYECGWHLTAYDRRVRKSLILIMARAQRPITITLGGFGVLSLGSYMKLLKFCFSVYTLLSTMMAKQRNTL